MSDIETTTETSRPRERGGRRAATAATLMGVLLVGGAAGATLFGPLTAAAASPTAQPSTPAIAGPDQISHLIEQRRCRRW